MRYMIVKVHDAYETNAEFYPTLEDAIKAYNRQTYDAREVYLTVVLDNIGMGG